MKSCLYKVAFSILHHVSCAWGACTLYRMMISSCKTHHTNYMFCFTYLHHLIQNTNVKTSFEVCDVNWVDYEQLYFKMLKKQGIISDISWSMWCFKKLLNHTQLQTLSKQLWKFEGAPMNILDAIFRTHTHTHTHTHTNVRTFFILIV